MIRSAFLEIVVQARSDFLVIGSGVAGLSFALRVASQGSVILLTKRELEESNTRYAQGGIAAVWSPRDSPESHVQDTLDAGGGLCRRETVEKVVREGPGRVLRWCNSLRGEPTCYRTVAAFVWSTQENGELGLPNAYDVLVDASVFAWPT